MSAAPEGAVEGVAPAAPVLRMVRGAPDDAELAALVAVVAARLAAAHAPAPEEASGSRWDDPADRLGVLVPSPDAWRTSAWAGGRAGGWTGR
ncbi:acyl-CoA carboxylase epsilon subunit [Pseudokineococcus marinus]|uniref:Acyl-CoA carboxylase subunit epsilon n=1 Tax=Pseudokineococcus marinus TaxID=351215 RepID=A0A849BND0_9ACTN|nr:acyl-CoA carboxylase epsilon subunit [Pseudokineococcus marinus]NNH24161.1 acyl-CoA carboxylase subunit epsilon [Pseudokineococcus marinus]